MGQLVLIGALMIGRKVINENFGFLITNYTMTNGPQFNTYLVVMMNQLVGKVICLKIVILTGKMHIQSLL